MSTPRPNLEGRRTECPEKGSRASRTTDTPNFIARKRRVTAAWSDNGRQLPLWGGRLRDRWQRCKDHYDRGLLSLFVVILLQEYGSPIEFGEIYLFSGTEIKLGMLCGLPCPADEDIQRRSQRPSPGKSQNEEFRISAATWIVSSAPCRPSH